MAENPLNLTPLPIHIYGNDRLSDRVQLFQRQATKHEKSQQSNPFSDKFDPKNGNNSCDSGSITSAGLSKDDPRKENKIFT